MVRAWRDLPIWETLVAAKTITETFVEQGPLQNGFVGAPDSTCALQVNGVPWVALFVSKYSKFRYKRG